MIDTKPDVMAEALYVLNERCKAVSFRPAHPLTDPAEFKRLVAFRDDLSFKLVDENKVTAIFDQAVEAFKARAKFARMCHEAEHGDTTVMAQEYAATAEVDEGNNYTGNIGLHFQQVLKK